MRHADTDPIRVQLLALSWAGSFAACHELSAMGLDLEVEGVGSIRLPPTAEQLVALLEVAQISPFGRRSETLTDPAVRRSSEIAGAQIQLDPERWPLRLERAVASVASALGVPEGVSVRAELQKLVLYREGDFFVPHRDTERDGSMWGSLVVVLPGSYEGGAFEVHHGGESVRFDTAGPSAARRLSCLGFYADCLHEVHPVARGCRLALTFSLHASRPIVSPPAGDGHEALSAVLGRYFADNEVLVHLLDHRYTVQRSAWGDLKGADAVRVAALRRAAEEHDCACFLALAHVQERYEYGGEEDGEVGAVELGPWRGGHLDLSRWIDEQGRSVKGLSYGVADRQVVATVASKGRGSRIEGHPWTGNEGGEAHQWYEQAAVVLVARSHAEAAALRGEGPERGAEKRVVRRRRGE